jgi:YVTN family beta-propeller protein
LVIATATNSVIATIPLPVGGSAGDNSAIAVAVSPDGSKVYVTGGSYAGPVVWVIAAPTNMVIATIPVGAAGPGYAAAVALSPDGSKVYVANNIDNTVSVIATATNPVIATIPVGTDPDGMAVTPDGSKVYVANFGDNTVSVIATATNLVSGTISGFANPIAFGTFIAIPSVQSVPSSGTLCNGTYDGTFNGSILVSAGQNCAFLNGGQVTGNVHVAGNFVLSGAIVGGNLTVNGTGSFTLGPAAMIGGSLNVRDTSSSDANNSICGTTVVGNMYFDSNGAAVRIGSADPWLCAGNKIGGYVVIINNTNATLLFNNLVSGNMYVSGNTGLADMVGNNIGGNLQCANNGNLIMDGGNKARGIVKQCH